MSHCREWIQAPLLFKRFFAILLLLPALALPVMAKESPSQSEANRTGENNNTAKDAHDHGDAHAHHVLPMTAPLLFKCFCFDSETGKGGWLAGNNSMVVMMFVDQQPH